MPSKREAHLTKAAEYMIEAARLLGRAELEMQQSDVMALGILCSLLNNVASIVRNMESEIQLRVRTMRRRADALPS